MKVKLDDENWMEMNPKSGRIVRLYLSGKTVIQQTEEGLGSGSYLMFPWANRVQQNPFLPVQGEYFDGNGLPLHGLYVDHQRDITISPYESGLKVELVPQKIVEGVPKFREFYTLSKGSLKVEILVEDTPNVTLPFCFGYHPYLQIDQEDLKDLKLTTDINVQLQLKPDLLPVFPYQTHPVVISSTNQYDSLFQGGTFVRLESKQGFNVEIRSHLPYWQIYTPPNGKCIAVEPMSFTANLYKIVQEGGVAPTLKEGSFTIAAWQAE